MSQQVTEAMAGNWRICVDFPLYEINRLGTLRGRSDRKTRIPTLRGTVSITYIQNGEKKRGLANVNILRDKAFPGETLG